MADRLNSNCFVLTRPSEDDSTVTVVKMEEHNEGNEKKLFYQKSFDRFFLNKEGRVPEVMHRQCLSVILPTISHLIHHERPEDAEAIRKAFLEQAEPELISEYETYPDRESSLFFIINFILKDFIKIVQSNGLQAGIESNEGFYNIIKKIYFELPLMYVTQLVEMATP